MGDAPIHAHATATIAPGVVLDATHGAIAIDRGATVRPGAIIVGPAYVGEQSTVLEHALIKANTAIGPVCKVAGEVGGSILQSHSNKGHDGHIGDTWIGQWVNLGAGTTNSNLLNTYGEVTAACSPRSRRERTGLTFFGAIIADHVKTAICTKLMTGSVIGLGAMIACTAPPPTSVRRFAWLTDAGESRFRLDRFFDAADRMMERRSMSISPELRRRLEALHDDQAD
jgi:UDP-N-acetylglucosamine diphosphorylase/glucosamine-1-phosphate N-acetyltransferase